MSITVFGSGLTSGIGSSLISGFGSTRVGSACFTGTTSFFNSSILASTFLFKAFEASDFLTFDNWVLICVNSSIEPFSINELILFAFEIPLPVSIACAKSEVISLKLAMESRRFWAASIIRAPWSIPSIWYLCILPFASTPTRFFKSLINCLISSGVLRLFIKWSSNNAASEGAKAPVSLLSIDSDFFATSALILSITAPEPSV